MKDVTPPNFVPQGGARNYLPVVSGAADPGPKLPAEPLRRFPSETETKIDKIQVQKYRTEKEKRRKQTDRESG